MIGVIYIARGADPNWYQRIRRFAESWQRHPPGIECQLYVNYKEFDPPQEIHEARFLLRPLNPVEIFDYIGFNSYGGGCFLEACAHVKENVVNTLVSTQEVMHDNWLAKMYGALQLPTVGMVGATGSYYFITQFFPMLTFPNIHLRDGSIMIEKQRYIDIAKQFDFKTDKMGYLAFEHGPNSLSRQVMAQGKTLLCVENDRIRAPHEWGPTTYHGNLHNVLLIDRGARDHQDI